MQDTIGDRAMTTTRYSRLGTWVLVPVFAIGCGMPVEHGDATSDGSLEGGHDVASDSSHDAQIDAELDAIADARVDAHSDAVDVMHDVPHDTPPPEPNFDTLPWDVVGLGVSYKDSHNPRGENVFIGYAGFNVTADQSRVWATQLFHAWLHDHGVRFVYSVQGPAQVDYASREIQNTHLIATMLPTLSPATHFIAIAGHSSGAWVACELMQQLFEGGLDPMGLTSGRTVYYDMDGVQSCVDDTMVAHLRHVHFMSAHTDVGGGGWSINATYMMQGAMRVGSGGFHMYDASGSGCQASAGLCLHVSLINTHPNDPSTGLPTDYADYSMGMVNTWFLSSTAGDLPL